MSRVQNELFRKFMFCIWVLFAIFFSNHWRLNFPLRFALFFAVVVIHESLVILLNYLPRIYCAHIISVLKNKGSVWLGPKWKNEMSWGWILLLIIQKKSQALVFVLVITNLKLLIELVPGLHFPSQLSLQKIFNNKTKMQREYISIFVSW